MKVKCYSPIRGRLTEGKVYEATPSNGGMFLFLINDEGNKETFNNPYTSSSSHLEEYTQSPDEEFREQLLDA